MQGDAASGVPFQMTPMREASNGEAAQRLFESARQLPAAEAQAPPKISVVVRKRPLNAQASLSVPHHQIKSLKDMLHDLEQARPYLSNYPSMSSHLK